MKAIIADDQPGVRSALRLLLEQQTSDYTIVEAADVESLLSEVISGCPDILLLDVELAGIGTGKPEPEEYSFADLVSHIRESCPNQCIIALSSRPDVRSQVISSGVNAFVCKTEPPEILVQVFDQLNPCL